MLKLLIIVVVIDWSLRHQRSWSSQVGTRKEWMEECERIGLSL